MLVAFFLWCSFTVGSPGVGTWGDAVLYECISSQKMHVNSQAGLLFNNYVQML